MNELKIYALGVVIALVVASTTACGLFRPEDKPKLAQYTAKQYFTMLDGMLKDNPNSLKPLEGKKTPSIEGEITKIDGPSIQFHIDYRLFRKDHYISCRFQTPSETLSTKVGDYVAVEGVLDNAFPSKFPDAVPLFGEVAAVKIKDCRRI